MQMNSMASKIKYILVRKNMTLNELADKIGTNGNNLSNKLSRNNFREGDLHVIAEALNCDFDGIFTLRDSGTKI